MSRKPRRCTGLRPYALLFPLTANAQTFIIDKRKVMHLWMLSIAIAAKGFGDEQDGMFLMR
jgi:hypothetical protein